MEKAGDTKAGGTTTSETISGLARRWTSYELILFLFLIPLLIIVIYFLPDTVKQSYFILYPSNPNISSIFLSNYTHSEVMHIISNLVAYVVIMFLLFNLERDKRIFGIMTALVFLVLPWLLSWYTITLAPNDCVLGYRQAGCQMT